MNRLTYALDKVERALIEHGSIEVEYNGAIKATDIVDHLNSMGYDFIVQYGGNQKTLKLISRDIPRVYVEV